MFRVLALLFVLYIAFSQYLLSSYDEMNSKLLTVNGNLLSVCSKSTIGNPEKERY
jgi:hypothetical protein